MKVNNKDFIKKRLQWVRDEIDIIEQIIDAEE